MPHRNQRWWEQLNLRVPFCLARSWVGMDDQSSRPEKVLRTCLTVLPSSQSISLLSPLLLSSHLPFFCHQLGAFPSVSSSFVSLTSSQILIDRGIFSTLNGNSDPSGLVTEMQKCEENRWKKFRRSFFKTMSWLTRHFSYCIIWFAYPKQNISFFLLFSM